MPSASAPPSPTSSRASSVAPQTPPPKLSRQSTGITFRLPSSLTNKPANALLQCELCQRRIGLWAFTTRPTANEATGSRSQSVEKDSPNGVPSTPSSRIKKTLPQRAFDILKEHRSYCPYVVRSTVVPSMPLPQTSSTPTRTGSSASGHKSSSSLSQFNGRNGVPGALEGWRAVLTVVLRYGMVEKQRIEYGFLAPRNSTDGANADDDSDKMDVDSVKAMVSGVKARGGKDLLKYVKGLLG
ncbi:hypothetical protein NLJ89_g1477 [Agrocybe chaxingu]|uniref:NuBaID C-terminal domain-containing protein n=1 Tax=Agrocybe chaxingu TaxID=84603 RepID=A0A9W8MZZ9_9AGAR|nr:hypothetical protein NLJ89_g1477 [Agrocybe chaxingu]